MLRLHLHVTHQLSPALHQQLAALVSALDGQGAIMGKLDELRQAISDLEADVSAQTTVVQSAVTLLDGLSAQLRDVIGEATTIDDMRQRLQNLNASLDTERDKLAASVAANTPAEPQPDPSLPVEPVDPNAPTEPEIPAEPVEPVDPSLPVEPSPLPPDGLVPPVSLGRGEAPIEHEDDPSAPRFRRS